MSDTAYAALKLLDQRRRAENRDAAKASLDEAQQLAKAAGFVLRHLSDSHYQLRHTDTGNVLDVYPGNQRLRARYAARVAWRFPHTDMLPCPWTLVVLVNEVIRAKNGV